MSLAEFADLVGAVLVVLGAFLCLSAAVGLVRFPDVLTRMHAATKPQTLGLLVIVLGVAVSLREPVAFGTLFLVAVLQLMTNPVSAHMVARAAYRSNQVENGAITTDELAEDLARAGFALQQADPDEDEDDQVAVNELDPGDLDAEEGRAAGTSPSVADPPSRRAAAEPLSAEPAPEDNAPEEIVDATVEPVPDDPTTASEGEPPGAAPESDDPAQSDDPPEGPAR